MATQDESHGYRIRDLCQPARGNCKCENGQISKYSQHSQHAHHSQHSQTCKRPSVIKSFEDLLEDEPPSSPSVRAARSFSESSTILAEILRRLFAALFAALFDRDFLQERSRVAAPVPLLFIGSDRVCRQWPAMSQHLLPARLLPVRRNQAVADVIAEPGRASQYPPSTDRGGGARPPSHMRDTSGNAASPVRTPLAVAPGSAEPDATEPMCFAYMCFAYMCFAHPGSHLLKCAQARAYPTTLCRACGRAPTS